MGTKSFVDAYEQMIREHNQKVMGSEVNDHTNILKEADDDKEQQDDEQLDLDLDEGDQEEAEDQNVQDEQEDVQGEDDDQDEFDLNLGEDDLDKEPQSETNPEELNDQNEVAYNFPDALLNEFINTVNQFTRLCAEVVQNKSVTTAKSKDLDKLVGKIKNLLQAAQKSI